MGEGRLVGLDGVGERVRVWIKRLIRKYNSPLVNSVPLCTMYEGGTPNHAVLRCISWFTSDRGCDSRFHSSAEVGGGHCEHKVIRCDEGPVGARKRKKKMKEFCILFVFLVFFFFFFVLLLFVVVFPTQFFFFLYFFF